MSKTTFTAVKSRGERPQETKCNGNLITGYTPHGIKTARALSGLNKGTGEPKL
jgi:hypothetical protein